MHYRMLSASSRSQVNSYLTWRSDGCEEEVRKRAEPWAGDFKIKPNNSTIYLTSIIFSEQNTDDVTNVF